MSGDFTKTEIRGLNVGRAWIIITSIVFATALVVAGYINIINKLENQTALINKIMSDQVSFKVDSKEKTDKTDRRIEQMNDRINSIILDIERIKQHYKIN